MKRLFDPVDVARHFLFVRETLGVNRGAFVEAIQRTTDNRPGDAWCMSFVSMCLWIAYQGKNPLPRTGACAVAYDMAKDAGWIVATPQRGDVFFRLELATDHAHHTGFVTQTYADDPSRVGTIAGNTSEDGLSREGVGVFEHDVTRDPSLVFVRVPETWDAPQAVQVAA